MAWRQYQLTDESVGNQTCMPEIRDWNIHFMPEDACQSVI